MFPFRVWLLRVVLLKHSLVHIYSAVILQCSIRHVCTGVQAWFSLMAKGPMGKRVSARNSAQCVKVDGILWGMIRTFPNTN